MPAGFQWNLDGRSVGLTASLIDAVHGVPLGLVGIQATELGAGDLRTHYGPPGHADHAGDPLRFRLLVTSFAAVTAPPDCGALAGLDLLPRGPLENVGVDWQDLDPSDPLREYGQLAPEPAGLTPGSARTGAGGIASLRFTPDVELLSGRGPETTKVGTLLAHLDFGLLPGDPALKTIYQVAGSIPLSYDWQVSFHEQFAFDASLAGKQSESWSESSRDDWTVPCGVDSDGSGTETMLFDTPQPTRVVFYQAAGGDWKLVPVSNPFSAATFPFPFAATLQRSGTLDVRDATPGLPCAGGGGGGGGPANPPPSDCGHKYAHVPGELAFGAGRLEVTGNLAGDPFESCPIGGEYGLRLLPAGASAPFDQIADRSTGRLILTGDAAAPHEESWTNSSTVGTSTFESHDQTSIHWSLTLDRVESAK